MNKVFNRGDEVIRAEALGKTSMERVTRSSLARRILIAGLDLPADA